ncbi:MAG: TAG lipase/steryl ester hydrolase/phospholipase A2/LPA acyltransferase [Paraglaciecola sp.]|jgi:TAG lipase/steryl ester hydrolase/phospholipase A2/LPA acyltransferase
MANKRLSELMDVMKKATSYEQYKEAAEAHDELSGAQIWKTKDPSKDYDYRMIRKRVQRIKQAKSRGDATSLMYMLHEGLHGNLGNIAAPALNHKAKLGTKHLIEEFIQQVCESLSFIYQADENDVAFYEKLSFFDEMAHAFGRSCIMLSGGAGLGFFHGGVVKSLVEHDLMPDVISGASAGSIIAALVGTRTNEELKEILEPKVIYEKFSEWRLWQGFGQDSLLNSKNLENALIELFDLTTFEEAYQKTGRHMTVTVSPADLHQFSRLLNAKTSPNAIITQAVIASCAIPIVFKPVQLKAKSQAGEIVPYIPNRRFADGSIVADLPFDRLARLYGVNHSIVSQTNPISVLFLARDKRDPTDLLGLTWRHAANIAKINSIYAFDVIESAISNKAIKLGIHKVRSIIDQIYVGDINILPNVSLANLANIVANPSENSIAGLIQHGERATWPHLDLIKRNTMISKTLRTYLKQLKERDRRQTLPYIKD